MSRQSPHTDDRLFRLGFYTVEYFAVVLVVVLWVLPFTGSVWGSKIYYNILFSVSVPVMIIVAVSGALTWRCYRGHALVHFGVILAWLVWAAMPRV